jgi:hypothetical protein
VFSSQIWINRSKVFPATLLVGDEVRAVAAAFATAEVAVLVYCVWAHAPDPTERRSSDPAVSFMMGLEVMDARCCENKLSGTMFSADSLLSSRPRCHLVIYYVSSQFSDNQTSTWGLD